MTIEVVARNPKDFSDKLLSLKDRKKLCDVSLIVKGERFPVHSNVLAASSTYFESLFVDSDLKEMTFNDVDADAIRAIIDFCYTGTIKISEENAEEVFILSSRLSIPSIVESSSKILEKNLSFDNYLATWRIARQGKFDNLKHAAVEIARKNFMKTANSKEFLSMDYSEIDELLDSNTVETTHANEIYKAVKKWIEHDRVSREKNLRSLLDRIKWECFSRDFLMSESLLLCKSNAACYEKFINVQISRKSDDSSSCDRLETMVVIGSSQRKEIKSMEIYDIIDQKWIEVSIDWNKSLFSTILLNDKLLIIGGYNDSVLNTVECYDFKSGKIETYPPMEQPRRGASAVVYKGFVFVIGGYNKSYLSHVEKFDPTAKTWTDVESMTTDRYYPTANVLKDEIFVAGGSYNYGLSHSSTEAYNISTGKWRLCASMKQKRYEHASAVVRDFLYIVGGFDGVDQLKTVERYDPNIDKWSEIQSMDLTITGLSAVNYMGKLVISGGLSGTATYLSKVEMYDENTNEWKPMASLNKGRTMFSLIEVPWDLVDHIIFKKT